MPAPKTTRVETCSRRLRSIVAAKAVRNAVSSSALRRARGEPEWSRSVREPRGAVLCELAMLGATTLAVSAVLELDGEGETRPDELTFRTSPSAMETIFIPTLSQLAAGMKRVVVPLLSLMAVLWGWFAEQASYLS